jgi:Domain of unknown function (DUF2760)
LQIEPLSEHVGAEIRGVNLAADLDDDTFEKIDDALLGKILAARRPKDDTASAAPEAARPAPVPTHAGQADAEIVNFLATLQARGRLVDFLMDDINAHDDAQVGAAARVVHAGCKAALQEHFRIRPVREESEGSIVHVAAGYPADEYRLLGRISGQAPFSGVLVHHGWKTDAVKCHAFCAARPTGFQRSLRRK